MKTGTKSVLFGVHQFLWHPLTVWFAWVWLYRSVPTFREAFCILVHDWGYWGKAKMDDELGERHPEVGAKIAGALFGQEYYELCLLHSRHYARNAGKEPSALCWADKLSIVFEPWWFYLPRAIASGEINEYREMSAGFVPLDAPHRQWFNWVKDRFRTLGYEKRGDVVPYVNQAKSAN